MNIAQAYAKRYELKATMLTFQGNIIVQIMEASNDEYAVYLIDERRPIMLMGDTEITVVKKRKARV